MGIYKDIQIPDELDGVIHYMREVEGYREELSSLGQQWDLLTILGQMSGDGIDMSGTREGFKNLTAELLGSLGTETLRKSLQIITSKAQVAVDIVVRNLFERTADIGFLATDDDIRQFLRTGEGKSSLELRFKEYVAKYSVYDDIVLLGLDGSVLARINNTLGVTASTDPLIREAIETKGAYVESFRHTDLCPHKSKSLLYSYRVTETNDPNSKVIGVLVLCFRFENETEGVFGNLVDHDAVECICLIDAEGEVIGSSDSYHIPVGARLTQVIDKPFQVLTFAGRKFLAKTCLTKGYQGYMGPGWSGHVMLPLDQAFSESLRQQTEKTAPAVMEAVLQSPKLFSEQLRRIPKDAERIQRDLDRSVWNGNVRQEAQRQDANGGSSTNANKVLLWEISKTGARTKSVFERSIKNLRETVVSTILSNVSFLASLAIDIMDRNLYERANDCRWWALTSAFRSMLAKGPFTLDDRQTATDILKYINGLYTVYSNLFLFDRSGTVLAVSNPKYTSAIGRVLTDRYIHDTLSNHRSQWYTASPFVRSDLYDNDFTYIYAASITSNTDSHRIVGGIGIVFDSTPQFAAMIRDSLPLDQNQEPSADCFGAFIDRNKNVISSTSPNIPVGEKLDIPDELVNQASGEGCSRIIPFNGSYYGVGAHTSAGYREYKGEGDSYKNDVTALIFVPLAEEKRQLERASTSETLLSSVKSSRRLTGSNSVEIASFFVGEHWLGVNANRVVEAVRMGQVNKVPHAPQSIAGITIFNERVIPVLNFHSRIGHTIEFQNEQTQIVVLQSELGMWGLIADRLGPIPTVDNTDIDSKCGAVSRSESFVMGLVGSTGSEKWERVLILLDPMKVMNELLKGSSPEVMKALALPASTT